MMKKKYLLIILILSLLFAVLYAKYQKDNANLFNDPLYNELDEQIKDDGLLIAYNCLESDAATGTQMSYWLKKSDLVGYLLIKSFFSIEKNFHVKVLIDYTTVNFRLDNLHPDTIHSTTVAPREKKIIKLEVSGLTEGAHEMTILIFDKHNQETHTYPIRKSIFIKKHAFPHYANDKNIRPIDYSKKIYYYNIKNNYIHIYINSEIINEVNSIAIIAFKDYQQLKFNDVETTKFYNLVDFKKKKMRSGFLISFPVQELKNVNKKNYYFLLINNPYTPVEFPPGKVINSIDQSIYKIDNKNL